MKNVTVTVKDVGFDKKEQNEALEAALRKFHKELDKEGVLNEVRDRQYYVKPSKVRHQKVVAAQHKAKISRKGK